MPIHVLGQTDNKYKVVLSNETDGKVLLNKMNRELGTLWTIMNQPYYVKWSYLDKDEWDIEDTVLKTMVKYGVEVRELHFSTWLFDFFLLFGLFFLSFIVSIEYNL